MPVPSNLIACPDCDLLQREIPLPPGGAALCPRCGKVLYRMARGGSDRVLALLIAAAIAFAIANVFPIVGVESHGDRVATTLIGAIHTLWQEDMRLVACLVFATTLLAPALELSVLILILAAFRWRVAVPGLAGLLRLVLATRPWSMVEVFMLGVLVAVVKLSHLAAIMPGVALWSYAALLVLFAAAMAAFDPRALWAKLLAVR